MLLTGANSQLVYQSALALPVPSGGPASRDICVAAPSTGWFPVSRYISASQQYSLVSCHPRRLWSDWEVGEGNENLVYRPRGTSRFLLHAVKSYDMGPPALLPIRNEGVLRIFIALKIYRLGRA
jgi:hypothetical protein